jgi:hypothetical protein
MRVCVALSNKSVFQNKPVGIPPAHTIARALGWPSELSKARAGRKSEKVQSRTTLKEACTVRKATTGPSTRPSFACSEPRCQQGHRTRRPSPANRIPQRTGQRTGPTGLEQPRCREPRSGVKPANFEHDNIIFACEIIAALIEDSSSWFGGGFAASRLQISHMTGYAQQRS